MKLAKIILGAKNTDWGKIKDIIKLYAIAGVDIFDLCANSEIIDAAKLMLKNLKLGAIPKICASITLEDDIHATKVHIIEQNCCACARCVAVCPQNAISVDNFAHINISKCTGCRVCTNFCRNNAIEIFNLNQTFEEQFSQAQNADYIEIHTNGRNKNLYEIFEFLAKNFQKDLGICISQNNNTEEKIHIIEKIKEIIAPRKLIVQADGNSISGFDNKIATTEKAIEECRNFQNIKNIILIASGGTNMKTSALAEKTNTKIDGIAWGSFARKLFDENDSLAKAKELIETIKK